MRTLLALLVISSPLLAACQQAQAMSNNEMAHCVAAFGYEREVAIRQSPPRYEVLPPMTASVAYYRYKLTSAGVPDAGRAEIVDFLQKNAANSAFMMRTAGECGEKAKKDPEYKKQFPELIRFALQNDPICKQDASLCAPR